MSRATDAGMDIGTFVVLVVMVFVCAVFFLCVFACVAPEPKTNDNDDGRWSASHRCDGFA